MVRPGIGGSRQGRIRHDASGHPLPIQSGAVQTKRQRAASGGQMRITLSYMPAAQRRVDVAERLHAFLCHAAENGCVPFRQCLHRMRDLMGMDFINRFMEHLCGQREQSYYLRFFSASSTSVSPNTVWYRGAEVAGVGGDAPPGFGSNLPGACQMLRVFFGRFEPLPFTVCADGVFRPFKSLMSRRMRARFFTSCPLMDRNNGCSSSKMFCC